MDSVTLELYTKIDDGSEYKSCRICFNGFLIAIAYPQCATEYSKKYIVYRVSWNFSKRGFFYRGRLRHLTEIIRKKYLDYIWSRVEL